MANPLSNDQVAGPPASHLTQEVIIMTAASGARVAWYYVKEDATGNIPATPEFKPIRFTSNGLTA